MVNISLAIILSVFIKVILDSIINLIDERKRIVYKNTEYFARVFVNLASVTAFTISLIVLLDGDFNIVKDVKVLFSLILIFSFVWSLFFTKEDIINKSNDYLKKAGIDRESKNFRILIIDLKVLLFSLVFKLSLEIFMTIPYVDSNEQLKVIFDSLIKSFDFMILFFSILFVQKLFSIFLDRLKSQMRDSDNESVQNYLFIIPAISNLGKIIIYGLFFALLLNIFGYTPTSFISNLPALIQSIGILGAGLAFMAKDTISNFLSGIFILTDTPFAIGDRIRINDIYGDVVEIGLRTTKIKTLENTIVTIPNSKFTENAVTSFRKFNSRIRVYYTMNFEYGSNIEKIKEIVYDSMNSCDEILKVPNARVYFVKFSEYSLEFRLIFWIRDINKKLISLDSLNTILNAKLSEENINIPFPTMNIKKGLIFKEEIISER
jgi:small-conductance mechanosensitive channel